MIQDKKIIERIITPPTKSKDKKEEELKVFKNNIDLLTGNSSIIKEYPEYYFIHLEDLHVGLAYLGDCHIPLGALLELWEQGILVDHCDQCHGKLYIYKAAGSPLSGSNLCIGICLECGDVSISLETSGTLVQALQYVKKRQNLQKVIVTKRQYFSFQNGLDGEPDIEEVLSDGVTPVTILQLIQQVNY
ncbi:MAG: hypothetical protein ACOCQD_03760 [archaeon]